MKNVLSIFLSILLLSSLPSHAAETAWGQTWNKAQLEKATIYHGAIQAVQTKRSRTPKEPPAPPLKKSIDELQHYIKEMTGVEIPIAEVASAKEIKNAPAIVIGYPAKDLGIEIPKTEFKQDGYGIKFQGNRLLIAGESDTGSAFAISDFLHHQGIRWYMPGPYGEIVPKKETLVLPSQPVSETPAFIERRLWLNGGSQNRFDEVSPDLVEWFNDWLRHNRLNQEGDISVSHMWSAIWRSNGMKVDEAFEQHPEWFAVARGALRKNQLNLLHEGVVDLFVNHYFSLLKKGNAPKDTNKVLSISPADQVILNDSAEAQKWMDRPDIIFANLPDATDYLIQFNNRVVEKLNKEYPNVRLAFYIYSNYQNAPMNVQMNKNLIPFIAPLNFSRYHALTDRTKPNRTLLANIVNRWHEKADARLGWRDYSFLCPDVLMPFNRMAMTQNDIPWLYKNGVRYLSTETVSNWPNLLPEFYLLSRLLWNPDTDQKKELSEFYTSFFGPAAKNMLAYVEDVTNAYESLPFSSGNKEFVDSTFTPERLKFLRGQIDESKKLAANDEKVLHRVELVETALKQAERFMKMRAAVNRFDYAEAEKWNEQIIQAFEDDLKFDQNTNTLFARDAWYMRFYGNHVRTVHEWLKDAKVVHVFPDEWPAHLDFTKTGEEEDLQNPETSAFDLFSLKTYSRSLAEQGLEKVRTNIWYRQRFPKIEVPQGKQLYIVFGGVDRFLKAWINGEAVGEDTGGRGFDPILLPVKNFKSNEENTLTVRVNNEAITELGVGGLIRPVALVIKEQLSENEPSQ